MIDPGTAIAAGGQIIGAFSGKKKKGGNPTSNAISALLQAAAKRAMNDDPTARINDAVSASMRDTGVMAEKALGNVFGKYAQSGSFGYLPDTARSSVLRGTMGDIGSDVALWASKAKSQAFEQWLENSLNVIRSASAGKGEPQQSNNRFDWQTGSQVFGKLLSDAFKRGS